MCRKGKEGWGVGSLRKGLGGDGGAREERVSPAFEHLLGKLAHDRLSLYNTLNGCLDWTEAGVATATVANNFAANAIFLVSKFIEAAKVDWSRRATGMTSAA
jgi:hypothetical protein